MPNLNVPSQIFICQTCQLHRIAITELFETGFLVTLLQVLSTPFIASDSVILSTILACLIQDPGVEDLAKRGSECGRPKTAEDGREMR